MYMYLQLQPQISLVQSVSQYTCCIAVKNLHPFSISESVIFRTAVLVQSRSTTTTTTLYMILHMSSALYTYIYFQYAVITFMEQTGISFSHWRWLSSMSVAALSDSQTNTQTDRQAVIAQLTINHNILQNIHTYKRQMRMQ